MNEEQLGWLLDRVAEEHAQLGQTYAGGAYRTHLEQVVLLLTVACRSTGLEDAGNLSDDFSGELLAVGILHDWFEDCLAGGHHPDRTSNSLTSALCMWQAEFGVPAVSLMMALRVTDPSGMSRDWAKATVLPGILACEGARCVKLADRIANLEQSIKDRSGKYLALYVGEASDFAPVADLGMTPDDAVVETRCYAPVRVFLANHYLMVLEQAKKVLVELAHQP